MVVVAIYYFDKNVAHGVLLFTIIIIITQKIQKILFITIHFFNFVSSYFLMVV